MILGTTFSERAAQPELRCDGSLIFLSGVRLADLLGSLKACKCHAPISIEPMVVRAAPGPEFIRACIRLDDYSAFADDVVVHLSRALLPSGEGTGHTSAILEDRKEVLVLPRTTEPQHTYCANTHPFHLSLLVTALRESSAAYQQGSDSSPSSRNAHLHCEYLARYLLTG